MTNWLELGDCIHREIQERLPDVQRASQPDLPGPELLQWLKALNAQTTKELDAACAQFSREGSWPKVSAEGAYLLALRLMCALDLLNVLCLPEPARRFLPDLPTTDRSAALVWLLNTTWEFRADHWLKVRAATVAWGGSFY